LVLVFTPNRQSLFGALEMARCAVQYRKSSDDLRPLRLLPLASRIEAAEPVLRDSWRFGDFASGVPGYQPAFEGLFTSVYDVPACNMTEYFSEIQIQHVPRFAYGEDIPVQIESNDRLSLTRSIECFLERLRSGVAPWESPQHVAAANAADSLAWLQTARAKALARLSTLRSPASLEVTFSPEAPLVGLTPKQLLDAAASAQVPIGGWPIGAVLSTPGSKPYLTNDGIQAEIVDHKLKSYDLWVLRSDGKYYFLRTLEEDTEYLLLETRIDKTVELLLYCSRLYTFLGVPAAAGIRICVNYRGIGNRILGSLPPDSGGGWIAIGGRSNQDEVAVELLMSIAAVRDDIVSLVKALTETLFFAFGYYRLPETGGRGYDSLVRNRLKEWL
jgi:hypothetical protein